MEQYVAFLRGINVSGQRIIKMEVLRKVLSDYGLAEVKSYIQSGNVLFKSNFRDEMQLVQEIEDLIENEFGFRTDVILRKIKDLEFILNSSPIGKFANDLKYYITFLKYPFTGPTTIPSFSKNKDIEIIFHNGLDFICISSKYKGNYGFPNSFIEKTTRIPATTRNPNTLEKILAMAEDC